MKAGLLVAVVLAFAGAEALAQALTTDPTRPPPIAQAAPEPASAASAAAAAQLARPRLQGVRLGQDPSALISGQLMRPGQKWQGWTLVRVESHFAWLRDEQGRTLRLSLIESNPVGGRQP